MTPKLYELWPKRLWTRGRTNELSIIEHRALADDRRLGLVVSVCTRDDPKWEQAEVRYWHRPMADGKTIPDRIEALADEIAELHTPTLIFCNAGRNRSPFLAGLVMTRMGITGAEAVERIDARRPNALANPLFRAYLRRAPAQGFPAGLGQCIAGGLRC